jgi:CHAT domain-containing protein/tetratricopeptide (TPR) repeat protein
VKLGACAAILLAATCACVTSTEPRLRQLYDSSTDLLWRGELSAASSLAAQGTDLTSNGPSTVWAWRFRLLTAEILVVRRDLRDVPRLLDGGPPTSADFDWIRAKQQYLRGQLHLVQGRAKEAVAHVRDAIRLASSISAVDVTLDAQALEGQALMRLGEREAASDVFESAVKRAEDVGDRYRLAVALVNAGMSRVVRNRFDEALPYFERTVSFADLERKMIFSVALSNAGICYYRLGSFERALSFQTRAVEAHRNSGERTVYLQRALGELGTTYLVSGDAKRATDYLQQAFEAARTTNARDDAARWADNLTSAYSTQGAWDDAERMNAEAKRLNELAGTRTFVYNTYHRGEIAAGRGQRQEAVTLFEGLLSDPATPPALRWDVHAQLGGLSVDGGRPIDASRHFRAALDVIEGTRSDLLATDYKLSFLNRLIRFYERYIDVLVDQRELDAALTIADSSRARVLAERHGVAAPTRPTVASFRRAAADLKGVLLFYWIGSARSYAWVIARDQVRFVPLSTSAAEIGPLVRDYQKVIVESLGDPIAGRAAAGDQLYEKLIAPVAPFIPPGTRVVIVPDGELNTLNFETLPVPGEKRHYWIEDVEVAIAPSLGTLSAAARPAASRQGRSVLLIGDPVSTDPAFPQLKFASAEMTAVSNAFVGRTSVYRADQATPGRYRESKLNEFGIVHFTAHASANAESPLDSAVILSRDGSGYKLYARDVAEQSLSADLVTISACRSAGERTYAGEGLVGFAWAFLRAGAQRVIAGLWDVDDRSTAELMGRVYTQIAEGRSPAAALRATKLEMIARGGAASKPYYWGPFQVFIGSRVVP